MADFDEFFPSINVDDLSELISATSNADALSVDICDYLRGTSGAQLHFPQVSNFNSNNNYGTINNSTSPTISNYQQSTTRRPLYSNSATNDIQTSNRQQVNYQQIDQQSATERPLYSNSAPYDIQTSNEQQMNYQQITQQPRTVCPFYTNSATNDIHEPNQEQVEDRHSNQLDSMVSEDFYIISQPREKFHPRTESESIKSSHFVRCEDGDKYEYPITNISQTWRNQKNVIQVTLLGIDNQPHPYTIKNKECGKSSLVVKKNESNTIYYDVTNDDLVKGYKSYKIELIKGRQDGKKITKEKINQRQLNQSKLRFTRFYQTIDGSYERDESSVIDTIVMTEEYGKFRVEDVFPLDGPMQSKRKICIETKGPVPNDFKTNFVVNIIGNDINCSRKGEEIKKNGNNFSFEMPVLPNVHMNRVEAKINVQYKKDLIYQANYLYISSLDRELNVKTSNESNDRAAVNFLPDAPSTSSAMEFNSGNRSQKRTRK